VGASLGINALSSVQLFSRSANFPLWRGCIIKHLQKVTDVGNILFSYFILRCRYDTHKTRKRRDVATACSGRSVPCSMFHADRSGTRSDTTHVGTAACEVCGPVTFSYKNVRLIFVTSCRPHPTLHASEYYISVFLASWFSATNDYWFHFPQQMLHVFISNSRGLCPRQ
jgi:hypothetical protein